MSISIQKCQHIVLIGMTPPSNKVGSILQARQYLHIQLNLIGAKVHADRCLHVIVQSSKPKKKSNLADLKSLFPLNLAVYSVVKGWDCTLARKAFKNELKPE